MGRSRLDPLAALPVSACRLLIAGSRVQVPRHPANASAPSTATYAAVIVLQRVTQLGAPQFVELILRVDLDNTLVGSGRRLREGLQLQEAVVDAKPVPKHARVLRCDAPAIPRRGALHLEYEAERDAADTLAWLEEHGLAVSGGAICLVPSTEAKRRVWRQVARDCQLVIAVTSATAMRETKPLSRRAAGIRPALRLAVHRPDDIARSRLTPASFSRWRSGLPGRLKRN
jgi:hypothetical protein